MVLFPRKQTGRGSIQKFFCCLSVAAAAAADDDGGGDGGRMWREQVYNFGKMTKGHFLFQNDGVAFVEDAVWIGTQRRKI